MLSIIWYFLLPRTFFPFTIPSRASFSRQFLPSQWPSQFLFLFLISSSIILPSPTLSITIAFSILSAHFTRSVHRCGPGGSMRACHVAGPGSIPGRYRFLSEVFFRVFSSPARQMSGSFRPPRSPNIIWPSLSSSLIIHYGRQRPEMLTRPKTLNIHRKYTYHNLINFILFR